MDKTINVKELRACLPLIVERVRRGERFTVLYRSRPAFRVIPADDRRLGSAPLEEEPLYRAAALGHTDDGLASVDHDKVLYGKP